MGLIKELIIYATINKAHEAITGQPLEEKRVESATKEQATKKKRRLKARRDFFEAVSGFWMSFPLCYVLFFLFPFHDASLSWADFYRSYAIAVLVSCVVFIIALIAYGLYVVDLWPLLILILIPVFCSIMAFGFEYGFATIFTGAWMNSSVKLVFSLLGIFMLVVSCACLGYYESGYYQSKVSGKKAKKKAVTDEDAENTLRRLKEAIQENAISIRLLKGLWGFKKGDDAVFGYDSQNKQFIFVNNQNSHILSCKNIVYLASEDVTNTSDSAEDAKDYQRFIKLYYWGTSGKELILPLAQIDVNDGNLNVIKYYANNCSTDKKEIVFCRKIRHLASTLERDYYPARPFVNDDWFVLLKECMENIRNNRTDGYSLFKESVIANEEYMDNATLRSIVSDLSISPPDKTSAKKEARRLCRRDFGVAIKETAKNIFSGN